MTKDYLLYYLILNSIHYNSILVEFGITFNNSAFNFALRQTVESRYLNTE